MPNYRSNPNRLIFDPSLKPKRPSVLARIRSTLLLILQKHRTGIAVRVVGAIVALIVLASTSWIWVTSAERSSAGVRGETAIGRNASLGGKLLFPTDNHWNIPIDDRPVDPLSETILLGIGLNTRIHPDFGTNRLRTVLFGIPYLVVDGPEVEGWYSLPFDYDTESDSGPYPIPRNPPIEKGGDHHLLVVDRSTDLLYELYDLRSSGGIWEAGSGAIFDLKLNNSRPRGWTSADAAGLAILPGLVRADEVYDFQEIRHALRFTLRRTQRSFIYPARHAASRITDTRVPPMGLRMRLRADLSFDDFPAGAKVIAQAMKRYGIILADNGGPMFLTGTADRRWRREDTEALKRLTVGDFEVIVPPPPPTGDTLAWRELEQGEAGFVDQ